MQVTALIPAAGRGTRFGRPLPKQFATLVDRPLIEHTLARFETAARVTQMILVVAAEYVATVSAKLLPQFSKLARVVAGGERRQDSVRLALETLTAADDDLVIVHCGARPFIRPALIDRCIEIAAECGACIVARPVHDTVKRVRTGETIAETVDRSTLWLAQTPQAFRYETLLRALQAAERDGVTGTDEAALVERLGCPVRVIVGDSWNLKITTPEDLAIAEAFVKIFHP